MGIILIGIFAIIVLFIILKILAFSLPVILKFVWNGIIGLVILFLFNMLGSVIGITLELTAVNAVIAGVFGIPGIIFLLLFR